MEELIATFGPTSGVALCSVYSDKFQFDITEKRSYQYYLQQKLLIKTMTEVCAFRVPSLVS